MAESAFAQHLLSSVRNELDLLKKYNYIQPKAYDEILRLLPTQAPQGFAEALYDFTGENPSADLSFRRGDTIKIVEFVNDGWWKGSLNGRIGMFPSNYVKKLEQPPPSGPSPALPSRRNEKEGYGMPNQSYPPPAATGYSPVTSNYPPPPPQYAPSTNQYPPPPTNQYPPPSANQYPPPAANQYPPPTNQYAPPPAAVAPMAAAPSIPASAPMAAPASAPAAAPHEESKIAGFGKQLAGNVANAATWGFGGTIGSEVAHSIF